MRSTSRVEPTDGAAALPVVQTVRRDSALWLTWNEHRRSSGLCDAWGVPLLVVRSSRSGALRWVDRAAKTFTLLRRVRPQILFVQNPSLALTALATSLRPLFRYYLVVDAHNEGVRPFARRGRLVRWLTRQLLRSADTTLVTNSALLKDVAAAGGRALVLPDRLPEPDLPRGADGAEVVPDVVVISSFMADEPVAGIVAAARMLPHIRFAFTGDLRRFHRRRVELPGNVRLTGYLADKAFWNLLSRAPVVCDLTLKPDCLVCGAYEALALAKPMVLSDNPATRELFGPAAVLTSNEAEDIARAVQTALDQRARLAANARTLRDRYAAPWDSQAASTWNAIRAGVTMAAKQELA